MVDTKFINHCNDFDGFLKKSKKAFEERWQMKFESNAKLSEFEIIKTLGTGSFGRVSLVRHCSQKQKIYAMKIMEKAHLVKLKQVSHVMSEIRILDAVQFEFLINMQYFFKGNVYIYLVMPFINGGEMFSHLRMQRKFDEMLAKFYAAQIILAFEYLHNLGIIYRDLKPENILIDKDGYLKITDYGFCKKIDNSRTYTLCGTPEYLAPEIIMSQGYNKSVDWWAIGIIIYEMSAGYPPFYAKDPLKIYEKIVSGKFVCPPHFSKPLKDLLNAIIQVDRSKRYGMLKNGARDVKAHDWFKSIDWDAILYKKVKPSFKPKVVDPEDSTNFDRYEEIELRESEIEEFPNEFAEILLKT
ncbi:cAMP-dependent protein kinase catalytic subunit alpha-like [Onthophagus taurus]|uniref:cAMP-dependent protein kinase catalytic subunit alpha-like n=1 Tax=Onthophagus taurus TaxID=166361 RepID=UPI000C200B35|nr:cAMP-dependent protein kinase catalytic subunit alpha-like [Onthophagus taurus]